MSLCAGVFLSPYGIRLIRPHEYASSPEALATVTLCFTRLVLGIQLVIAGIQLPSRYLKTEWRSLAILLGPGMLGMWVITSFLVWQLVPDLGLVQSLIVGACVTPTDPVLSNSIVKGTFADKHMSRPLQKIIIAESGANDGLGYLFLFLPLYLVKFAGQEGGTSTAVTSFLSVTCLYTILLSVVYGAVAGWAAKHLLFWADRRRMVDKESLHLFAIALAVSQSFYTMESYNSITDLSTALDHRYCRTHRCGRCIGLLRSGKHLHLGVRAFLSLLSNLQLLADMILVIGSASRQSMIPFSLSWTSSSTWLCSCGLAPCVRGKSSFLGTSYQALD